MYRLPFLFTLLLALTLVACDSGMTGEPEPEIPDTTDTPPPDGPPAVDWGNLAFIGTVYAWEAVGTGYPTGWRFPHQYPRHDSTNIQLTQVRTLDGNLVLSDSFYFTTALNFGGYDHREQVWREQNDTLRVSGTYVQEGNLLILEPETCDLSKGPVLGIVEEGEVSIYRPGPRWEHRDVTWLRFAMEQAVAPRPGTLPEGTYPITSLAEAYQPCQAEQLPFYLGGGRYTSRSLQDIQLTIAGDYLSFLLTYKDRSCSYGGSCNSSTTSENAGVSFVRQGDLIMGKSYPGSPFDTRDDSPRVFGYVKNDTLVLHGFQVTRGPTVVGSSYSKLQMVARFAL